MNKHLIFDALNPDVIDRLVTRRDAIRRGVATGTMVTVGLAAASIPLGLAALARNAFAQDGLPQQIVDVLNFALTLEYLEDEFYKAALAAPGFAGARSQLTPAERSALEQISKHESAHVAFLATQLGGAAVAMPTFDFTGGNGSNNGPLAAAASDKNVLLAAAQAFEDTGVRAYKGQVGGLLANNTVLQAALRIHSVEARHAAQIRRLRGASPWITGDEAEIAFPPAQTAIDEIYAGEQNTAHGAGDTDITGLGQNNGGVAAVTESFDEPLSREEVLAIVGPFIAD